MLMVIYSIYKSLEMIVNDYQVEYKLIEIIDGADFFIVNTGYNL